MENRIRIKWFDELDSTNSEALRHISEYDNLSVLAAVNQTAGRGQRGNRWLSSPGDNLTFSLVVKPSGFAASDFMALTFLATLTVRDWLRSEGAAAVIKWPNDIYVRGKKICGMLIENGLDGGVLVHSVIGIGLNLNQTAFPGELVNPTSLKRLTGHAYDLRETLLSLCRALEERLPTLGSPEGRSSLHAAYQDGLFQSGLLRPYRDLRTGEGFEGTIQGVTYDGRLQIDDRFFSFKEVGYIL
ncbi:MAG: biotin--[Bacteroidales bacterium]|nr:biotin--[acetyl-CoA-carboxylase] ligase [Bacteroidales bacterium]